LSGTVIGEGSIGRQQNGGYASKKTKQV
jgi:hypothetical protein